MQPTAQAAGNRKKEKPGPVGGEIKTGGLRNIKISERGRPLHIKGGLD